MNYHSENWIMENLNRHFEEAKRVVGEEKIVGIFLQGSQNYGLDILTSDIDTKCIIIPSFKNIILNDKLVSTTHVLDNGEHLDLKDIRLMFNNFRKQNINFLEILFTKYKIMNPFFEKELLPVFENKEKIAHYNNYLAINCMVGMAMEKVHALEHLYPSWEEHVKKYGYSNKQLHHIIRMREFLERYLHGEIFNNCLLSNNAELLTTIKKVPDFFSLEEAREMAKENYEKMCYIKQEYMKINPLVIDYTVEEILNNVIIEVLKKSYRKEFLDDGNFTR